MKCNMCGGKMKPQDETVSMPGFDNAAKMKCMNCGMTKDVY